LARSNGTEDVSKDQVEDYKRQHRGTSRLSGFWEIGNAPVVTEIIPISRPSVPCLLSPVGSDTLKFISCANPCVQKVLY
jgi:hypothetical protein